MSSTRGLFNIFVVDPEQDIMIEEFLIVANDQTKAFMKASHEILMRPETTLASIDNYDFIVCHLGDVRPKRPTR